MTDLTTALAVVGALVIGGVVAHGAWQSRKAGARRAADAPPSVLPPGAVAPGATPREAGELREPVFDVPGVPGGADGPVAGASTAADPAALAPPPRRLQPPLDALIDAIAPMALEAPVSGDLLLSHLPPTRRAGAKPFFIEGLNDATGEWEAPVAGQRYRELQAGVQLANRTGALNEIEYSEFVQKIQAYGEQVGAMADFPDMLDVVARGRELDAFAGDHDAQLAVHLRSRSAAWSVAYIQQHAGRHGFVPGAVPGRLVLPSTEEGAPPVLVLAFDPQAALAEDPHIAALRDVTLSFDVPQTDSAADPFAAWQASAQALSLGMDAAIVDDQGQPLSPQGFASIAGELKTLYAALASRDLAAGSGAARRLFS